MKLKLFSSFALALLFGSLAFGQYCTPSYGSQCTSGDYIDNFTFATISNLGTGCSGPSTSNYTNYSATISTTVFRNGTYLATCSPGPTWGQYFGIWIDLNQNLSFADPGEYFPIGYAQGGGTVSANVTIPLTASLGPTRMRVLCQYSNQALLQTDVCSANLSFGEVEDYTINILSQPAVDGGISAIVNPTTSCGLTSAEDVTVTIYNTGLDTIFTTPVCYSLNNGTPVCETFNGVIAPAATQNYTFSTQVNVSNPQTYSLDAWTSLTGDTLPFNDTLTGYQFSNIPQISSLPYIEGFENGNGGWISSGTANSWQVGVPINSFISGAANGQNAYVTNLTGDYNNNELSYVTSPCFDFSGLANDPKLRFSHIFTSETGFDASWVDVSTNGGTSWTKLYAPGQGINWYNDTIDKIWDDVSGNPGVWRLAEHPLTGTAGNSDVRIRFVFSSDGSVVMEGFGVDNVSIFDSLVDMTVTTLLSPQSSCGLSATEPIQITMQNLGTFTQSNIPVCFSINGGTPVCETVSNAIAPGATFNYTFTGTANLGSTGLYSIKTWTALPADSAHGNDTLLSQVDNIPVVNTFPYTQGFENGNAGWTSSGNNNSWELGQPVSSFIPAAANGLNAWVTNLNGDYNDNEESYLISPCLDFSGLSNDPKLRFSHIFTTETCCDQGWVDYSTDGGLTWTKINSSPQATNWYNDLTNQEWNGNSGNSGQWRIAETPLTGLAGESSVRIRWGFSSDGSVVEDGFGVDNVFIYDSLVDFAVLSLDGPMSGCGLGTDTISATVFNYGTIAQSSVSICYAVNGGTPVCETISGTLTPGNSVQHSFSTLFNFSAPGVYAVKIYVTAPGDSAHTNDTILGTVTHVSTISSFPYFEDFENGPADWVSDGGATSTWAFGTPAKTSINSASSGVNAWVNGGLSGTYNNSETSWVIGPCMDFSSLQNPWVKLDIWRESEFSWDGAILQATTDNGLTWNTVGQSGDPDNWYNDSTVQGLTSWVGNGDGWTGAGITGSNGWITAKHALSGYAGNSTVRLRIAFASDGIITDEGFAFDNFLVAEAPTLNLGPDSVVCDTVYLLSSGYTQGQFAWSTGDTTPNLTIDSSGTYELTYTDAYGLSVSDTIMLTLTTAAPFVEIGNDTIICLGTSLCLNAGQGPGWTYLWSGGATTATSCFTSSGVVTVTVADQLGCTASDTLNLVAIAAPVISFTADTSNCPTVSFTSNNTGGAVNTWAWQFGDGNGSGAPNPTNTYGSDNTYQVTLTATNGCSTVTVTNPVVVNCLTLNLEEDLENSLSIYPNPALAGEVFVKLEGLSGAETEIHLLDLQGKALKTWHAVRMLPNQPVRLELPDLTRGLYFLEFRLENQLIRSKLLIH
ncbi:MAG: T9SS type A sorting domain-containing protein [Bacteroidia bacterium]|nr:T9SS type A sorting domain-containing protein [Bacteroidia bacterium]